MLRHLKIKNLAVIESAEIALGDGFSVLTGETGAGKSLIVGAIELLLGGRADTGRVRTGEKSAHIEGVFENNGNRITIRRNISAGGRSRAWVDGSPVALGELRRQTIDLADLLGQHEHQILLDPLSHVFFLDSYAGISGQTRTYTRLFTEYEKLLSALDKIARKIVSAEERTRLREFELEELEKAELDPDEWGELNDYLIRIAASEKILEAASVAAEGLLEGEHNAASSLTIAERAISDIRDIVPECARVIELLETAQAAVEEASREVLNIAQSVEVDPGKADELRQRQMFVQRLCRKYDKNLPELIEHREGLKRGTENLDKLRTERAELETRISNMREDLVSRALELTSLREKATPKLCSEIADRLAPLGMDNVIFQVRFTRNPAAEGPVEIRGDKYELLPTGAESAEFHISPNPGEELRPLAEIVSGGELSRIMLALKTLTSEDESSDLLVFDEVDTGIGGDIGHAVGEALTELAKRKQLLVITHLPQIARRAGNHYVIKKYEEDDRTKVTLKKITGDELESELTRMHGGEKELSLLT